LHRDARVAELVVEVLDAALVLDRLLEAVEECLGPTRAGGAGEGDDVGFLVFEIVDQGD
jgi:hypothetical protein